MTIAQYIQNVNAAYHRGDATEHTYRGDLKPVDGNNIVETTITNTLPMYPSQPGTFTSAAINPPKNGSKTAVPVPSASKTSSTTKKSSSPWQRQEK